MKMHTIGFATFAEKIEVNQFSMKEKALFSENWCIGNRPFPALTVVNPSILPKIIKADIEKLITDSSNTANSNILIMISHI